MTFSVIGTRIRTKIVYFHATTEMKSRFSTEGKKHRKRNHFCEQNKTNKIEIISRTKMTLPMHAVDNIAKMHVVMAS